MSDPTVGDRCSLVSDLTVHDRCALVNDVIHGCHFFW